MIRLRSRQFKIKIIFFLAVILLLSLSVFSYLRINNMLKSSSLLNHTNLIKLELVTVFSKIKDADSHQRGYVLTKDNVYLEQFQKSLLDVGKCLLRIDELTSDNYSQQSNLRKLELLIHKRIVHMEQIIKDAPNMKITTERWLEARAIMEEIRAQTDKMTNEEGFLLRLRTKSFTEESTFTPLFTIFLTICSILALIAAYFGIIGELKTSNRLKSELQESEKGLVDANLFLEEKNDSLAKMNKELESFTYISSHDLQEPLRKIQTFISRITESESANLSENSKNYLTRTHDAANRMQNLIRDLLAYSRLNIEIFPVETFSLSDVVDEVAADLDEDIKEAKATIEVKGIPEVKIIVSQFRQLLTNLISNAIKFSKPDNPPRILIQNDIVRGNEVPGYTGEDQFYRIKVSDNGIGFDSQYKNRIFEVFQRLHMSKEYPGTGIGLAIVKKIIENHDGYITAESELNEGATFILYLPV